ncbi:MAG: hypothetical protein LBC74_03495, partial [Planctomycetaceae bacterium]|nr:hypothetical protein [Planctomycetaceae bacterium]
YNEKPPLTPPRPPLTPPKEGNKNTPPREANKKKHPSEANKRRRLLRRRIIPLLRRCQGWSPTG